MFGYRHSDLNRFNRPVRTRMPGGVGGARSLWPPPIPIVSRPAVVSIAHDPQNPLFIIICMLCFWKSLCIAASFRHFLVVLEHHVAMVRGRLAVGR